MWDRKLWSSSRLCWPRTLNSPAEFVLLYVAGDVRHLSTSLGKLLKKSIHVPGQLLNCDIFPLLCACLEL